MGRGRKAGISVSDALEQQLEKAQDKVIKTKAAYENAVDALQILLDKRDAQRKDILWKVIVDSNKSYEEIIRFISDEADGE